jgi:endonuclease/exonuclease/phosphatase (EEP) superfamily protein YafD
MKPLILVAAVAHVLGSAGLTVAALGALAGAFHYRLDLLTQITPIYLVLAVIGLLTAFVLPRPARNASLALSVVTILACAPSMVPEYLAGLRDRAPVDAPNQLKVIQFNAFGGYGDDRSAAAKWIAAQNPDIVVLEEAGGVDALIAQIRPYYITYGSTSAMIVSRSRPTANNSPAWGNPTAPLPNRRPPYPLVSWASFNDSHGAYMVYGVHRPWPTHPQNTAPHSAELRQLLTTYDARSAIVLGDFNTAPWSYDLRRLDSSLPVTRRTRGIFSWPAAVISHNKIPTPIPLLPIDQVYAGSDWKTVKVERGPNLGSDHYPVVVTLSRALRAPGQ